MFYLVFAGLIGLSAVLVLIPGMPLGMLTNAVQTLTGVLLPSATVFLLLLCNDKAVMGPWRNGPWLNLVTGAVIAALLMLSIILTAAVFYPDLDGRVIVRVLVAGTVAAVALWALAGLRRRERLWMVILRGYLVLAAGLVLVRIVQPAIAHHG